MCLIVFAWRPEHPLPLLLAANRDEFHARPSLPLGEWPEMPGLLAGRDLQAGGTWLGIDAAGRFAALTNIRDPRQAEGQRSRGELVSGYLQSALSPADYLRQIPHEQYSGFNLLLGDRQQLYHFNSREGEAQRLPAGVYGLSNASLNTPWPKLLRTREALRQCLDQAEPDQLLALLSNRERALDEQLPQTGVTLEVERLLSSAFIVSPSYGTRASTALILQADGGQQIIERSFGPDGEPVGEVRISC
jgi:uncharacterized protein with NRDE domain